MYRRGDLRRMCTGAGTAPLGSHRGNTGLLTWCLLLLLGGTIGVLAWLGCKAGDDCSRSEFMLLTGAAGAGAGGLIGLTIGALSPRWKRRFP